MVIKRPNAENEIRWFFPPFASTRRMLFYGRGARIRKENAAVVRTMEKLSKGRRYAPEA